VPGHCRFLADVRILPDTDVEALQTSLEAVLHEFGARWTVHDLSLPFATRLEAPVLKALGEACEAVLGEIPSWTGMPSWTNAEPFARRGADAVVFGPGSLPFAHTPEECVAVAEVHRAGEILLHLLRRYLSG
jgi:acetylornithine deacetylase/succinyl-diaminopimelate desuccinylase-like protein